MMKMINNVGRFFCDAMANGKVIQYPCFESVITLWPRLLAHFDRNENLPYDLFSSDQTLKDK